MKKILFIYVREYRHEWNHALHTDWVDECGDDFEVRFWGPGFNSDLSRDGLIRTINLFKPDYIYGTIRDLYTGCDRGAYYIKEWLPSILGIGVRSIFVDCDTHNHPATDNWYKQFSKLYCRQAIWDIKSRSAYDRVRVMNLATWEKIPLFRWSVSKSRIIENTNRHGIYFVGRTDGVLFRHREQMRKDLAGKVTFIPSSGAFCDVLNTDAYWEVLRNASALICPTESTFGDYVPAKIFEYAAAGAAILTNCDLRGYGMADLAEVVIPYTDLDDLKSKLSTDFTPYHNISCKVIANHTHQIRYKEIFQ